MFFKQFLREQTGCASYLVGDPGTGEAAVIDPHWQIDDYLAAASAKGMKIKYVLETHVHADHLSGNRKIARLTGAKIGFHQAAGTAFADLQLEHGDLIRLGSVVIQVIHTPGHTPESVVYAVSDTTRSETPWLVMTGDTLFIDDVGRPDLAGPQGASELFDSLQNNLLHLDSSVEVYPAHVAGSPCGRAMNLKTSSTIGYERRFNRVLKTVVYGRDYFVDNLTADLPLHSPSFDPLIATNRQGPPDTDQQLETIQAWQLGDLITAGWMVLDARDSQAFAAEHIPGSLNVPLSIGQMAGRVPWLIRPDQHIALVADSEGQAVETFVELGAVRPFGRIARLEGGLAAWKAQGGRVTSTGQLTAPELARMLDQQKITCVLDVREPDEWQEGHILDAPNYSYRELSRRWPEMDKNSPVAVICAGGVRSAIAASILENKGFSKVFNVLGGMGGWNKAGLASVKEAVTVPFARNLEQVSSETLDWVI